MAYYSVTIHSIFYISQVKRPSKLSVLFYALRLCHAPVARDLAMKVSKHSASNIRTSGRYGETALTCQSHIHTIWLVYA